MKVIIPRLIHDQIMFYVKKSPIEISGLGRVKKHDNGNMEVVKVYLLEQENTGSNTEIDGEAVAKLMYESREDAGDLNFWWHSHVNMGVFWSGTDMATIKEFGKNGYLLSTVFNKKGEMRSSYFQGSNDFLPSLFMDQLETKVASELPKEFTEQWEAEYTKKAKAKTFPSYHGYYGHGKGGNNYYKGNKNWFKDYDYYDYWDDDYDIKPLPKKNKKGKRGRPPKKQVTLLGDDDRDAVALKQLQTSMKGDKELLAQWRECLGALWDVSPENVRDENLWIFYQAWAGDYEKMQTHVITQLAINEADDEYEDTELSNRRKA